MSHLHNITKLLIMNIIQYLILLHFTSNSLINIIPIQLSKNSFSDVMETLIPRRCVVVDE